MSDTNSKKARRNAARERARQTREKQRAQQRRKKVAIISSVIVGTIAAASALTLVIANSVQPAGPGPKNMASDGILLKGVNGHIVAERTGRIPSGGQPTASKQDASVANITIYEDYMCPICNQFETGNMEQIRDWVTSGKATLEVHPFNLLDRASLGSRYSSRAAGAAACVANYDPDAFLDFNSALYASQPEEQTRGLSNSELASIAEKSGAPSDKIEECINDQQFSDWVAAATNRALSEPVPNSDLKQISGTPTVLVNGSQYNATGENAWNDTDAFKRFVRAISPGI